jgi:hypothetical protein
MMHYSLLKTIIWTTTHIFTSRLLDDMNKLIVIRHSERLDEVSKAEWKNILLRNALQSAKKDIRYRILKILGVELILLPLTFSLAVKSVPDIPLKTILLLLRMVSPWLEIWLILLSIFSEKKQTCKLSCFHQS